MMDEARQPEEVYPAWLEDLLGEAEAETLPQIRQAALGLAAAAPCTDGSLRSICAALEESVSRVDLSLLRSSGWLARVSGRRKRNGREFSRQCDTVLAHESHLKAAAVALSRQHHEVMGSAPARKCVLALQMECHTLATAVTQAAHWLELLTSAMDRSGHDAQLRRFAGIAAARITRLQERQAAANQLLDTYGVCAGSRAQLIELLERTWRRTFAAWQAQTIAANDQNAETPRVDSSFDAVQRVHTETRRLIHRIHACCIRLSQQEQQLLHCLTMLSDSAPQGGPHSLRGGLHG